MLTILLISIIIGYVIRERKTAPENKFLKQVKEKDG